MIFRPSTKKRGIHLSFLFLGVLLQLEGAAQKTETENSVFWEISGLDLSQPSYLFGTFHLMGSRYIDSLTLLVDKFNSSDNVVGELLLDSTMTMRIMAAARLEETTLDKLLDSSQFKQTAAWLKELSGYDLKMFNTMNPMTVQIFLMTMLQQKYFPLDKATEMPMDIYFQQRAKKDGKNLVGLESFEIQVNALFHQFSLQRQAEMLAEFVQGREKAKTELLSMNKHYRGGNLGKLEELLSTQTYTKAEAEIMLDKRNKKWMEQLPGLMKDRQSFIAVGALHLAGKNGLIALLRNAGYSVAPMHTR